MGEGLAAAIVENSLRNGHAETIREMAKWLLCYAGGLTSRTLSISVKGLGRVEVHLERGFVAKLAEERLREMDEQARDPSGNGDVADDH